MNGVFKVIALVMLMTALSVIPAQAVKIGSCSVKFFIFGGQSCLRTMTINLKHNPQRPCSDEYTNLKTCLNTHVTGCVKDDPLLKGMEGQITKLLLLQAYHCGDQRVDTSDISQLLWTVTKCKEERLGEAFDCWKDFDSTFHQSRDNTSNLCGPYAKAKKDCAEVAMVACEGLCKYLVKDNYNTFCPKPADGPPEDPPSHNIAAKCSDLHAKLECSDSFVFEKAMECEDQGVEKFANDNDHSCSKEKTRNRNCLAESLDTCTSNILLLNETERALQGTLSNERMFCKNVSLDPDSLHDDVESLANCTSQFFVEAENCAKPFRNNFQTTTSANIISDDMCSKYEDARECINTARKDYCNFDTDVLEITSSINNPFCPSEATKKSMSIMLQLSASIISFLLFF